MVLNKVEKRCAVCGRLFWKYPYHKKKTCDNPNCTTTLRRSHRLPDTGTCSYCGKVGRLAKKGKFAGGQKQCRKCWTLEHRYAECRGCRKFKKIYARKVCEQCFFRLELSTNIIKCKKCGRERAHYAKKLCRSCYNGIMFTNWRRAHHEKHRAYMSRFMKERARKERREHPEVVRARERRYRQRTPDDNDRVMDNLKFVTSAGLGSSMTGRRAVCVQKFELDRWKRIIIYKLTGPCIDGKRFVVQMIDMEAMTEKAEDMTADDVNRLLLSFGIRLH
jgi:hypothetical protein